MMRTHRTRQGFSLIEIVVLITIVSLAVPPMATLLSQSLRDSTQANMYAKATTLAKSMMEEVLSKEFEDPQLPAGSFGTDELSRTHFDDVDDYHGYSQSPPTDCRGNAFPVYAPFRVDVNVENVLGYDLGGAAVANGSTSYKRVTVNISWNSGEHRAQLVGLATSRDSDTNRPPVQLTFLERTSSPSSELRFRVRNDGDSGVYLTNIIATWSSWPEVYYEQINVRALSYMNYGTVWDFAQTDYVRMESGGNAMFNQGQVVYLPPGDIAEIGIRYFSLWRTSFWSWTWNMDSTDFVIEIWAGPDHCAPFVVPRK
jgi:MSHA pilin protein MshD